MRVFKVMATNGSNKVTFLVKAENMPIAREDIKIKLHKLYGHDSKVTYRIKDTRIRV